VRLKGGLVTEPRGVVLLKNVTFVTVPPPVMVVSAAILKLAGAVKTAPLCGLVIFTESDVDATTLMFTTAEVREIPPAVATALSEYCPAARLFNVRLKGDEVSEPKGEVPSKKETLVTEPPLEVASATMVTSAGAVKTAPFVGLVMLTLGGVAAAGVERV
jgi:hypothetical protein